MKTLRTAILDELYTHIERNIHLKVQESLGIEEENGKAMHTEWTSVKRDEGRIIIGMAVQSVHHPDNCFVRELQITVEKT